MKAAYPIVVSEGTENLVVFVPDFNISTQGVDIADAMGMARDAIGLVGIDMEDDGEALPPPTPLASLRQQSKSDTITLVDVDFAEYRRKNDMRTVRRNVSLPSWLDVAAKEADINVSAVLSKALKQELRLTDR